MSILRRAVAQAKVLAEKVRHNQQEERDLMAGGTPLPSEHGPTPATVDESDNR